MVLEQSHGRYTEAIRHVDEEKLLRNLVHMRYNEIPLNLNVSSIAAQYELAGGAEARPFFGTPNPAGSTFRTFTSVLPDVNASGANRPTITLIPSDSGDAVAKVSDADIGRDAPLPGRDELARVDRHAALGRAAQRRAECRLCQRPAAGPGPGFRAVSEGGGSVSVGPKLAGSATLSRTNAWSRSVVHLPSIGRDSLIGRRGGEEQTGVSPRGDGDYWSLVRRERRLVLVVNPAALGHPILEEIADLAEFGTASTPV